MPICVLDTESTGPAGLMRASIIEIGAVVLTHEGEELGSFSCFVKPAYPVGSWCFHAMQANQIDATLLHSAPTPDVVWSVLLDWLSLHKPVRQVLAFNSPFDKAIMAKAFPDSVLLPWGPCLMREASSLLSGTRASIKLATAAKQFGLPVDESSAHRALYDARLAGKVYQKIMQRQALY